MDEARLPSTPTPTSTSTATSQLPAQASPTMAISPAGGTTPGRRTRAGTVPNGQGIGQSSHAASSRPSTSLGSLGTPPTASTTAARMSSLHTGSRYRSGSLTLPKIAGGAFGTSIWTPDWEVAGDGGETGREVSVSTTATAASSSTSPAATAASTLSSTSSDEPTGRHLGLAQDESLLPLKHKGGTRRRGEDDARDVQARAATTTTRQRARHLDDELLDGPLATLNIPAHLLSPDLTQEQDKASAFAFADEQTVPPLALAAATSTHLDTGAPSGPSGAATGGNHPVNRFRSQSLMSGSEKHTVTSPVYSSTALRRGPSDHALESVQEDEGQLMSEARLGLGLTAQFDMLGLSIARPRANTLLENTLRARERQKSQQREEANETHSELESLHASASGERGRSPGSAAERLTFPSASHLRLSPVAGRGEAITVPTGDALRTRTLVPPGTTSISDRNQASRSLWIGLPARSSVVTEPALRSFFLPFGSIESVRVLHEKDCAFVNFAKVEEAVKAKESIQRDLGNRLGPVTVKVDFAKPEGQTGNQSTVPPEGIKRLSTAHVAPSEEEGTTAVATNGSMTPTRALWIGTLPLHLTVGDLIRVFAAFGPVESARILSHKQCGFVNFEHINDAVKARQQLHGWHFFGPEVGALRIGFAKVPPKAQSGAQTLEHDSFSGSWEKQEQANGTPRQSALAATPSMSVPNGRPMTDKIQAVNGYHDSLSDIRADQKALSKALGASVEELQTYDRPRKEYMLLDRLPGPSALGVRPIPKRPEASNLRDLKMRIDEGTITAEELSSWAVERLPDIPELASDYIGNTIVQALFERCDAPTRKLLLEHIAPHLASLGCHKNGTWAAQKILECVSEPEEMALVSSSLETFCPAMLLDQFGNYVVQGCLRFGSPYNQFVFHAISDCLWEISDGRFGARAIRALLENALVTPLQRREMAVAIIAESVRLVHNPNGNLLNSWVIESSDLAGKYAAFVSVFLPHLVYLLTNRNGSINVLKVMAQESEPEAAQSLFKSLAGSKALVEAILLESSQGILSLSRVLSLPTMGAKERAGLVASIRQVVTSLNLQRLPSYRRLILDHAKDFGDLLTAGDLTLEVPSRGFSPRRTVQGLQGAEHQQLRHEQASRAMRDSRYDAMNRIYGAESFQYMMMDPLRWSHPLNSMNGRAFIHPQNYQQTQSLYPPRDHHHQQQHFPHSNYETPMHYGYQT